MTELASCPAWYTIPLVAQQLTRAILTSDEFLPEVQAEIDTLLMLLKNKKQMEKKDVKKLHRRMKYWLDKLADLKYRAAQGKFAHEFGIRKHSFARQ